MMRFTFSKNERLSSQKEIDQLFKEGKSLNSPPLKLIWFKKELPDQSLPAVRVMFGVPKKNFPRAVDRNRMKRLMRESYRLSKNELFEKIDPGTAYNMAVLFTGKELTDYATIQSALKNALDRWLKKITSTPTT